MIRTQVYLDEITHIELKLQAQREKKSTAKVLREALEIGLETKAKKNPNSGRGLLRLAKMAVKSGDPDGSKNIDKYLYEEV